MKQLLLSILFLISFNSFAQVPSYIDTTKLSGWWSFTGNAIDSSLNANNGSVNGATLTTDRFGHANSAYNFDGMANYIQVPDNNSLDLTDSFTISIWVKIADYVPIQTILSKPCEASNTGYALRAIDGSATLHPGAENYTFAVNDCAGFNHVLFSNDTLGYAWTNLVVTYADSIETIYKNDTLIETDTADYTLLNSSQPLLFGEEFNSSPERYFAGSLDDIGIWKRVLSPCEIQKLYLASNTLIINQPSNDTVLSGGSATYAITDIGGSATYQWQQDTGSGFVNLTATAPYSGVTSKTLMINPVSASMSGYTYRCIRDGVACTDTSGDATLTVHSTTGIANTRMNTFTVAPNPATGTVVISSSIKIQTVALTDLLGREVKSVQCNDAVVQLDVSELSPGMYILRVNGSVVQKLIKQ